MVTGMLIVELGRGEKMIQLRCSPVLSQTNDN
jgi:hypothetical protein